MNLGKSKSNFVGAERRRSSLGLGVIILSGVFFSPTFVAASGDTNCQPAGLKKIGNIPAELWNLEVTGADLVVHERLLVSRPAKVPVGIIDAGMHLNAVPKSRLGPSIRTNLKKSSQHIGEEFSHGTSVASLIFSPEVGISPPGYLAAFSSRPCRFLKGWNPTDTDFYEYHYQGKPHRVDCDFTESLALNRLAKTKILNLSGLLGSAKITAEKFKNYSGILVNSAGNDPYDYQLQTEALKSRIPGVVVGTLNLKHRRGGNFGDRVDILAPEVTPALTAYSPSGTEFFADGFGMTSGATAQVTSTLVAVLSYLPEIDLKTVQRLLRDTGTTNPTDRKLINTYKLVRVAERIERRLRTLKQNPTSGNISALLEKEEVELLDFKNEADVAFGKAESLSKNTDCASVDERGRLLRKAYLLDPTSRNQNMLSGYYMTAAIRTEGPAARYSLALADFFRGLSEKQAKSEETEAKPTTR